VNGAVAGLLKEQPWLYADADLRNRIPQVKTCIYAYIWLGKNYDEIRKFPPLTTHMMNDNQPIDDGPGVSTSNNTRYH